MRGRRLRPVEEAEVDLTPMLDVVFILLIFFIVTAVFLQEFALGHEPPPPQTDAQPENPERAILIYIDGDNDIRVDGRLSLIESVRANVERLRATNPTAPVVIQADPDAHNRILIRIRDQLASAEIDRVNITLSGET